MATILDNCSDLPWEVFAAGEYILNRGDKEDVILILDEGVAEVRFESSVIATISTRGAVLGEVGVLLNQGHSADVVAVEDCSFYVIREASKAIAKSAELSSEISRVLARRLVLVSESLASMSKEKTLEEVGDFDRGMLWQDDDQFGHYLLNQTK
jgi:CRP-like cAMP-binding protein